MDLGRCDFLVLDKFKLGLGLNLSDSSRLRDIGFFEDQLKAALLDGVNKLADDQAVMLKLTLPDTDNLYSELVAHPKVVRVVALSGGYSRSEACEKLARNNGVIASFSRALLSDLRMPIKELAKTL